MVNVRMFVEKEKIELRKKNLFIPMYSDLEVRPLRNGKLEYRLLLSDNVMRNHTINALRSLGYIYQGKQFVKKEKRNMNNVIRDISRGIKLPEMYEDVHKHVFIKEGEIN